MRVDHIGRPVFATNAAGAKVWSLAYLPFGGVSASTGVPATLRLPGQWFQSENGLHQNWMRDYDPTLGRYLQADPLGLVDGASVYGYVKQNPGRWIDPRGEQSLSRGTSLAPGGHMASPSDYGRAWEELLDWSHNYNPIDIALQWCFRDVPWRPDGETCKLAGSVSDGKETICTYNCPSGTQKSILIRKGHAACPPQYDFNL